MKKVTIKTDSYDDIYQNEVIQHYSNIYGGITSIETRNVKLESGYWEQVYIIDKFRNCLITFKGKNNFVEEIEIKIMGEVAELIEMIYEEKKEHGFKSERVKQVEKFVLQLLDDRYDPWYSGIVVSIGKTYRVSQYIYSVPFKSTAKNGTQIESGVVDFDVRNSSYIFTIFD